MQIDTISVLISAAHTPALYRDAGTKAFASGDNHKAVQLWTHGLALDDGNAPLYSSRSAAYFELENLEQSMADANKCIDLAPKWCKVCVGIGSRLKGGPG